MALDTAKLNLKLNLDFKKLFTGVVGPPRILGIDIGTTSIKAVELSKEGGVIRLNTYGILENYGHLERINDAIQTSSLKILDEVTAEMLKKLLSEMKPTTHTCSMSVPVFSAFVSLMDLPQLSEKELKQAIPFEARQYVPVPISEVALDWQVLGPTPGQEGQKIQVLLVAVPQDTIGKYQRIAELAGLDLKALEIETIAAARAVVGPDPSTLLLVDIGSRATVITVVDEGYVRITRSIDTAGGDLTQVIANGLNVSPLKAEMLKKSRGLLAGAEEENLAALMMPLLDVIISEIQKLGMLYQERTKREIKKVILTGGSANIPGLVDYFGRELQKETSIGNTFSQLQYPSILTPILANIGPTFAVAVGLALKDLLAE
jgi:type IV pilus assembly protein PilM